MATTYRRAMAAFLYREGNLIGPSTGSLKERNPDKLARQVGDSAEHLCSLENAVSLLSAVAEMSATLHAKSHGSTVSTTEGNLLGRPLFAVSIYPQKSIALSKALTRDLAFAFAILNADLLLLSDHALGTWFDSERNRHVLDVVVCVPLLNRAISLGLDHGQRAIFDLKEAREISLVSNCAAMAIEVAREEY